MELNFNVNMLTLRKARQAPELFKLADEAGFFACGLADSQFWVNDPYPILGVAATGTKRVKIGTMITNPITRFPSVTACAISTINELSNGRAFLGIGAGFTSVLEMCLKQATVEQCRQSVKEIQELCMGSPVNYGSCRTTLRTPGGKIPIYLAADGERMLGLAGEVADGVILTLHRSQDLLDQSLRLVHEGATSSGRDSSTIKLLCIADYCISENRRHAKDLLKPCVGGILSAKPSLVKESGISGRYFERIQSLSANLGLYSIDLLHSQDWEQAAEQLADFPDEVTEKFAIGGNADDVIRGIRALEKIGISQVILRSPFPRSFEGPEADQQRVIETFKDHIIPAFR